MSLQLITPPVAVPISLAEIKAQCRVDSEDESALLAGYVRSAVDHIESTTGLRLITQTWAWTVDCFPRHHRWDGYLRLPLSPVQSITSITYLDANTGAQQTLASFVYSLNGDRVTLAPNAAWPSVWRGRDTITIVFTAGYGDNWNSVPESLRQAVQMLAAYWFSQREAAAIGPDQGPVSDVPFSVRQILDAYRVWPV
jgi:uncharacterized phiE125 gp8 family phage protein